MQRFLQLLLGLLGQGSLEDGAAVLGQRLRGLVRGHLLDHHEQRRRAGLQHLADLVLEGLIDAGLADTPHKRPYACPDGHAEERAVVVSGYPIAIRSAMSRSSREIGPILSTRRLQATGYSSQSVL